MILFLYGSLFDPEVWRRQTGALPRDPGEPARLSGWRRVGLRGSPDPTLRRGSTTPGLLRRVDRRVLRRLIRYEGPRYRLRRVVVATTRGNTVAWTWIAAGATDRPWKE